MRKLSLIFLLVTSSFFVFSEEGMLIPSLLEAFESDMKAMGMKISAEDIYNVNHASIKDAILHFGGGCTSELISDKGLLLTNHHCGFSQIYAHSTVENNIADDGFWAKSLADELINPNLTATRIVRIENVTNLVLEGTKDLSDYEAHQKILANIALIKAEALSNNHFEADIKPFDYGNSYYLMVKETFKDVRLVAAPPKSIGKFGGDTDNWIWPRHTGDFALFRVYTDKNNLPAEYHENNIPYQPIYHLPVSIKDRKENDFAMIFGFPGMTYQHTISSELDYLIQTTRPAQIKMRDLSLSVMNEAMNRSKEIEINYASKQARIANAWKKWKGQIIGLKVEEALPKKIAAEEKYTLTANSNPEWKEKYGNIVTELNELSDKYNEADFVYNLYIEYFYSGAEIFKRATALNNLIAAFEKEKDEEKLMELVEKERKSAANFFEKYNINIDKNILLLHTDFYKENINSQFLPELFSKYKTEDLIQRIYDKSFLTNPEAYNKTLDYFQSEKKYQKSKKKISKDIGLQLANELEEVFSTALLDDLRTYYSTKNALMKTFVAGKYEMFPDDKHWADANSTLRLSYGKQEGSTPKDGMKYKSYSTLKGIVEKYNSGEEDFELQPRMLELFKEKNYGDYAQDGELWVCFTSSLHTTGGNSGSPIIDGNGHLIGLNFDRSWESTMSDYMFDSDRCRNISVDIRYILWVIDIYGEAPHLVKEMTIIK